MADKTKISYLDATWSPVTGCQGTGCKANCWARDMVKRFPALHGYICYDEYLCSYSPVPFSKVQFHPDRIPKPLHWKKSRKIGVCLLGDLFDDRVLFDWIHMVWDMMKQCPQHKFFVLTKQVENLSKHVGMVYSLQRMGACMGFWSHVYLGASITDQEDVGRMIPELLKVPGKHWVSVEPLLGPVSLRWLSAWPENAPTTAMNPYRGGATNHLDGLRRLDWVVIGAESGTKRRPCKIEWIDRLVHQCHAAGIPVFVKQLNINGKVSKNPEEWPEHLRVREFPK